MAHQPTIDAYNKTADEYASRNSVSIWQNEYEIFFDLLPERKSIIEIGCGIGRDAEFLVSKYSYTGIDASEGMLRIARQRVPQGKFLINDFYHLDFADNQFDGFWAAASLLHAPKSEISQPLSEIRRVVKPQTVGLACSPNLGHRLRLV